MKIPVVTKILKANDQVAADNRSSFAAAGVFAVNVMASPGAGKTSLILVTAGQLQPELKAGVIEGDVASSLDAETIAAAGLPVVQINTGGSCHLDAPMVRSAIPHLPLDRVDVLFIENVGNLICPTSYDLGAELAVVVASVPEGYDKPYKYPGIFAKSDVVVLNKCDLIPLLGFDFEAFERGVRMVNASAPIFAVSCRTGEGTDEWAAWVRGRVPRAAQQPVPAGA
jgi:hydrogenase nickel incorporation protein HypB